MNSFTHGEGGGNTDGEGEESTHIGAWVVVLLLHAGNVRAELAGERVHVSRNDGDGYGRACEGRVVDGEEVHGFAKVVHSTSR